MKFPENIIKPEILSLTRIKDTFDDRFEFVRLDKKERLLEFDPKLLDLFRQTITSEDISGYYELGPVYRKLARYLDVEPQQILLTAGSDLAIKSVFEACIGKGDVIVLHAPCYAMFKVYADMFGVKKETVALKEDWAIDHEKMLSLVTKQTKMVVVENPNGFVGTKPDEKVIKLMAKYLNDRNCLLLLDEAYYYIENDQARSARLCEEYPNVLISQTFSKAHGLAGVRAGYLVGNTSLMEYISRVRPMHEIASLSARAVQWVLDHPQILNENRKAVEESKHYLLKELQKLNIKARNTHANFVMVYLPQEQGSNLCERLRQEKILVRRPFEEDHLKGWTLVCVGTLKSARSFLEALQKSFIKDNVPN